MTTAPERFCPLSYLVVTAEARGDAPAVIDGAERLSFRALVDRALRFTSVLAATGLRDGHVVGLHLGNVWAYLALELAIPNAGGIVMPLSVSLGEYELEQTLGRSGARFVVCDADRATILETIGRRLGRQLHILRVPDLVRALSQAPAAGIRPGDARRIVEIAVTSGTSGLPKLASRSAAQKQATFEGFAGRLGVGSGDRVLAMSPLTQGVGSMSLFTLRRGATQIMLGAVRFIAADVLRLAQTARVSVLLGVPTNLIRLLALPELEHADLSACRVTAVAGAMLTPDVAEAWERRTGSRVCIFYGSVDIGQLAVGSPDDPPDKRWHSVGRPHDCIEVVIKTADGTVCGRGEIGEICMRGATVQDGYWGEPRSAYEADGWAHLGDLGYLDEEGYLHVVGRVKDIIIRGGSNINPYEVEGVLRNHAGLADVCVIGRPDPDLGERAVAFVVPRPGADISVESLRSFLATTGLAKYKWPEFVETLGEIPLSGPGKVDRGELRRRLAREAGAAAQGR
jgi:acyl-CoA synthetase (AMP-forming)/AMP-acid ligase II